MRRTPPIRKLLVANRGEIATRIFRACTEMGIRTVAIFSHEDRISIHRTKADEAYRVGRPGEPVAAYLGVDEIVALARAQGVDAIHPGYGFLSENPLFAEACAKAGIRFVGPSPETLRLTGDKVRARSLAARLGIPTLPGTARAVRSPREAREAAGQIGYPLIVKAVYGGGGRGMRVVRSRADLEDAMQLCAAEANVSFGSPALFLERYVTSPRHLEVQLLGDARGVVAHLHDRDCSVQRRHQKMVEVAPATHLSDATRARLHDAALRIGRRLGAPGALCAATAEFLLDGEGNLFFIEVNPRIQVEHTVTEVVTGVDIVQAQIRLTEGLPLTEAGIPDPAHPPAPRGVAIQCRITTEDPWNGFAPDQGRITAFRSAAGFGIRLDSGNAFPGAQVLPFYDSLLVKVTAWGNDLPEAARRMHRALREFRVRGPSTNFPFLERVITNPDFLEGRARTDFIDTHPELRQMRPLRDRATRLLEFLAEITVNGNPGAGARGVPARLRPIRPPAFTTGAKAPPGSRDQMRRLGPEKFARRLAHTRPLGVTDTTFRDAHQSLLATRFRTADLLALAPFYRDRLPGLFSLEMWGGATFDAALRFLRECPWERLERLREAVPNILFQMLLRGSNAVGYTHYPDNVVRAFVRRAARDGIDLFRIFDSLNWVPAMRVAIDEALDAGALVEGALCYTGDIQDPGRKPYTLSYYTRLARDLSRTGIHMIAIKDMAGLCKPESARRLVRMLREETGMPVHFHTHDTAGIQAASVLAAADAGAAVVDLAMAPMSGLTSQPNLNSVVAALQHTRRDTRIDLEAANTAARTWEAVRALYAPFESGLLSGTAEVYNHEIPGGQFSNLRQQATALGLADRWEALTRAYREVNRLLGDIPKVTPSSKVVGDLAQYMVANGLTARQVLEQAATLPLPASFVELLEGKLGRPPFGFPARLRRVILRARGRKPIRGRPGAGLPPADLDRTREDLTAKAGRAIDERDTLSSLLYPKVWEEFEAHRSRYGDVSRVPSDVFFYGCRAGEEFEITFEPGKTLVVELTGIAEPDDHGRRRVSFELNGAPREVVIADRKALAPAPTHPKADPADPRDVPAPMAGRVVALDAKPGGRVRKGDLLCRVESMKMQTGIAAPRAGRITSLDVKVGDNVAPGDRVARIG